MLVKRTLWLLAAAQAACQETGVHTDWPRWCGKVYESGYPSFDPTGQTLPPVPVAGPPLLHVQFRPRYSIYLESDKTGEFIVNAALSQYHGVSWPANSTTAGRYVFSINLTYNDEPLVENSVTVNSSHNVFAFDLSKLTPRLDPYEVVIYGGAEGGGATASSSTELYYLPEKSNGSVTRIDNLSGGLYFRNAASKNVFEPLLSYGFFASYDGFLGENDTSLIQKYADFGLNGMTPLTQFPDGTIALDFMDKINLKWMYDLREGYKNLTWVREKVLPAKDHDGLYAYWLADEPDGWQDPFNATVLGAQLLKALDPYHPLAVVLNCQNYYFGPYTVAADIIMEDVYPIGINSTFSKWGTVCNSTLGDCGCDNCQGIVRDVSNRLDDLAQYEAFLGRWPKPKMHCPQSFHGEDYWFRDPTVDEEFVMSALAFNHGAKSIVSWVYPASEILSEAHGALSRVVTQSPVVEFLVAANFQKIEVELQDYDVVDASYWIVGDQVLVCIVNGGYVDIEEPVAIAVPDAVSISSTPWGNVTWELVDQQLRVASLPALATSILILSRRDGT